MTSKIGQRIKARLDELRLRQGWLAESLGVSDNAVSKWIKTGKISKENAVEVSRLLQLPVELLIHEDGLLPSPNTQAGQPPIQSPAENVVAPAFIEPRRWPFSPEIHDRILRLSGAEIAELESVLALQLELVEARLSRAGAETMPSKRAS